MKHLRPLLVIAVCALLTGCLPESVNPIAPPSMSVTEPRLEGVWQPVPGKGEKTGADCYHFHLRWAQDGRLRSPWIDVLGVDHPERAGDLTTTKSRMLPAKIGDRSYLSYAEMKPGRPAATFEFLRYDFDWRGRLRMWPAEEQPFIDAVRTGKLRGTVTGKGSSASVVLTDTSERIAAFVAATGDAKLFRSEPLMLKKVR
jgi:hypothetical protein